MPRSISLAELAAELLTHDNFVLCGHISPDGDCLGSEFALAEALQALGKKTTCLLAKADALDYSLNQLPGIEQAVVAKDYAGDVATFVSVDVPSAKRMGEEAASLHTRAGHTITIDHHVPLEPMSQVNYIDAQSPACALIVWDLIAELGVAPTPTMATCCYMGLMTDTGRFQYQNTNAAALQGAAAMVQAGANPAALSSLVYQNRSLESMALEERMLARKELLGNGQFALSHLRISDFVETGAIRADAEPLIDVLRCIRGVRVACLLREQENNVRGSLRAKDETDVAAIANRFNGGGHKAAAGFTFEGSLDDALAAVRQELNALRA